MLVVEVDVEGSRPESFLQGDDGVFKPLQRSRLLVLITLDPDETEDYGHDLSWHSVRSLVPLLRSQFHVLVVELHGKVAGEVDEFNPLTRCQSTEP